MTKTVRLTLALSLLASLGLAGCKKEGAPAPAPGTDKPADKPADAPADKPADKPADPAASWKPFMDPDGRFSVKFPGDPTAQKSKVPTAIGEIEMTMYMMQEGKSYFMAAGSPLGLDPKVPYDSKAGLEGARDQAMKNMNATVTADRDIEIGGLPGKELEFTVSVQGMTGKGMARIAVQGQPNVTIYQALALTEVDSDLPKLRTFVESLGITPAAPAPAAK